MPELLSPQFGLLVLAAFLASVVSTSVGFGFGVTLVSVLQFFIPPVQIVGLGIIIGLINSLLRVLETRKIRTDGMSLRVTLSGLLGVPLGVALLRFADPLFLKRYFSIAILTATVLLIMNWRSGYKARREGRIARAVQFSAGTVGGFMCGSSNLGGYAVVLCSLVQHWDKMASHAVFSRYFLATTLAAAVGLLLGGLYDVTTVLTGLGLVPVVWGGFAIGARLRDRISEVRFRQYLMLFLGILAVAGFLNTLGWGE